MELPMKIFIPGVPDAFSSSASWSIFSGLAPQKNAMLHHERPLERFSLSFKASRLIVGGFVFGISKHRRHAACGGGLSSGPNVFFLL